MLTRPSIRRDPRITGALIAACLLVAGCGSASPPPATSVASAEPSAQTLVPSAPAGLAEPSRVPTGWTLQRSVELEPGPPAVWARMYARSAVPDGDPIEGPGRLVVYQAFGVSTEWTGTRAEKARARGDEQFPVSVNGQGATVWHDASSGELLLAWTLDGKSLALVGNAADLSAAQLVEIAQGFVVAP
jgi:hypothetical protein